MTGASKRQHLFNAYLLDQKVRMLASACFYGTTTTNAAVMRRSRPDEVGITIAIASNNVAILSPDNSAVKETHTHSPSRRTLACAWADRLETTNGRESTAAANLIGCEPIFRASRVRLPGRGKSRAMNSRAERRMHGFPCRAAVGHRETALSSKAGKSPEMRAQMAGGIAEAAWAFASSGRLASNHYCQNICRAIV